MDPEIAQQVARWRFIVIAPLLDEALSPKDRGRLRQQIAARPHKHPLRGEVRVQAETLRYWCRRYRKDGFEGLLPTPRADTGTLKAFPPDVLATAERLKREVPQRSISGLIRILEDTKVVESGTLAASTLHRHLARIGLTARTTRDQTIHRSFETLGPGDLWQSDEAFFYFPTPEDGVSEDHLFFFLDDHSRFVPHGQFYPKGNLLNLEHCFKRSILKHGAPEAAYSDRGKVYLAEQLAKACAYLGIRMLHAAAYSPESKGKAERFIQTLRGALEPELRDARYASREERNAALWAWIDEVYHRRVHSETGQTPLERFTAKPLRRPSDEEIQQAFLFREDRFVRKNCVLRLGGHRYELPTPLARHTVQVRFDPEDPDHEIAIWLDGTCLLRVRPSTPAPHVPRRIQGPLAPASSQAGREYLDALKDKRARRLQREPLRPPLQQPDDGRLTLGEFLDLLRAHHLPVSPADEKLAATFFEQYGPFARTKALAAIRSGISRKGTAHHLSYYLDVLQAALLDPPEDPS